MWQSKYLNLAMKGSSDKKCSSSATELSDANAPMNRNSAQTRPLIIYSIVIKSAML